MGEEPKSR